MASEIEREVLYEKVLIPIGKVWTQLPNTALTGILSVRGARFNQELMVVGRAVNGWDNEILPKQLSDPKRAYQYSKEILTSCINESTCPLQWVRDYWERQSDKRYCTGRSAFWRVIKRVSLELPVSNDGEANWSSYLAWSNLYKIAPKGGGNPDNKLCQIQFAGCKELIQLETLLLSPKRIVYLTGFDWAETFIPSEPINIERPGDMEYVCAKGHFLIDKAAAPTRFVVAMHPQGKSEDKWVEEVMRCF